MRLERKAYQLKPVCIRMCLNKVVDVSIRHPVRYHCELGLRHSHPYQWQNIRMVECFPCDNLLAELLQRILSVYMHVGTECGQKLTPTTLCKSLSEYILMTFTATSRPQCCPFQTSANPPLNNVLLVRSNGIGIFKDVGRSAWWPHVLYNVLRQFSRAPGERSGLSSAWSRERVNASFDGHGFTVTSGRRTYLIYHVDKGLRVVSKEATDRFTLILTREDHFDQGGELV